MADLTFLGRTNWRHRSRPFGLRELDRRAHMYVIGKTGTGKSSLLEFMIRQDVANGQGLALFDPHGDLAERIVDWVPKTRRGDLIYLNVPDPAQPFGFNPLEGVPVIRRSLAANGIVEALKKMFAESWGYRMEHILRAALLLLLDQPAATIADVLRLFHEPDFRLDAAGRATNPHVARFWTTEFPAFGKLTKEAISPIENKLGSFLIDPFLARILTVSESTFRPEEVMRKGGVLVVNLAKGKIGESPAALFGGLLVSALGVAGLGRADEPASERRAFYLYLDEFQTFTTLALANMLAELRKYGVGLILANQFMEQLTPEVRASILGNVGTLMVFRVGAGDALRLAKELGGTADPDDLILLPNRSFWVRPLVGGEAVMPFTGSTVEVMGTEKAA
ncbi:MAG: type IV secretory system conjugative DNA transfer family protein [Acidobacteria bacterium]|nr:type IV secretory system conjugative DNA transfer family protein [Acidobacteriota bacterium]MBV9068505.1 type IV secretory system conjugative DNA transfer family protein [Acidobacteriota bacterium]MBV9186653.1 type IV secretory system conjugative DNA transfer family protein [Acidobacteriota bacterium]